MSAPNNTHPTTLASTGVTNDATRQLNENHGIAATGLNDPYGHTTGPAGGLTASSGLGQHTSQPLGAHNPMDTNRHTGTAEHIRHKDAENAIHDGPGNHHHHNQDHHHHTSNPLSGQDAMKRDITNTGVTGGHDVTNTGAGVGHDVTNTTTGLGGQGATGRGATGTAVTGSDAAAATGAAATGAAATAGGVAGAAGAAAHHVGHNHGTTDATGGAHHGIQSHNTPHTGTGTTGATGTGATGTSAVPSGAATGVTNNDYKDTSAANAHHTKPSAPLGDHGASLHSKNNGGVPTSDIPNHQDGQRHAGEPQVGPTLKKNTKHDEPHSVDATTGGHPTTTSDVEHKPSAGEKIKGNLEKMAGKITGNEAKVIKGDNIAHGRT